MAPQGLNNGWANTNGQDVTLIDNILGLVQGDLCVDTTQVFAMGWSFGSAMSYALACSRPGVFRAVVVYSGAQLSGCSGGTQPVAYFGGDHTPSPVDGSGTNSGARTWTSAEVNRFLAQFQTTTPTPSTTPSTTSPPPSAGQQLVGTGSGRCVDG